MKLFAFFIALLPTIFAYCPEENVTLENSLKSIFSSDFGYTLVGAKPISRDDSYDWWLDFHPESQRPIALFLKNAFKNSDNYIFRTGWYGRELINKESLLFQISKSTRLRNFVRKKFGTAEKFLDALQSPSTSVFDLLDRDDVLIGIALGYGEENAEFYLRRVLVGHYLKKYPLFSLYPFQGKPGPLKIRGAKPKKFKGPYLEPAPSVISGFTSLEQEWLWIRQTENSTALRKDPMLRDPYYLYLPRYVSRKGPQSEEIHSRFIEARDRLARLFCGRKVSEVVSEEAKK